MISEFDSLVWNAADTIAAPSGFNRDQWFSLLNAIIQKESGFNPSLVSWTGKGLGLMQINPDYWLTYFNITYDQAFDPYTNIIIGTQIVKDYITKYGTSGGLGAYFAGPSARLTSGAQTYAKTVLGYYSNFISKVKAIFQQSSALPGAFYFVDPATQADSVMQLDFLPETGTIPPGETSPEDLSIGITSNDEDLSNFYIIGAGLLLGYLVSQ